MTGTNATTCPITDEPATEIPTTGDWREFDCPACGRFRISRSSFDAVQRYRKLERLGFLLSAQRNAAPGSVPMIKNVI